jgi:CelD/BcsL family acetyltransferase involved in cellulose biosynthesis
MNTWHRAEVPLRFQVSDKTLWTRTLPLMTRVAGLGEPAVTDPQPPADAPPEGCRGWLLRSQPLNDELPVLTRVGGCLRYVPAQFQRYYIDLTMGFEAYKAKFSSKTRSTLQRKLRKWAEHCGGSTDWRSYRGAEGLREFHALARRVSQRTYQERLLDAGLPTDAEFLAELAERGARDAARGWLLFRGGEPVAYLYCPIDDGVLLYAYLGYDPTEAEWSPGTVLQWLALEALFAEGTHRIFDFTEGQSDHKRLFATGSQLCGNVWFLRRGLMTPALVNAHRCLSSLSLTVGGWLDAFGMRGRVRRFLRAFGGEN